MKYSNHWCPNKECPNYGKTGLGNIIFYQKYGPNQIELLICRTCRKTFSERKGTIFFHAKKDIKTICEILKCLIEGSGIRATARIKGVSKNTVKRYLKLAGQHSKEVSDYLIKDLKITEVQLDEFWSFIKKREKLKVFRETSRRIW